MNIVDGKLPGGGAVILEISKAYSKAFDLVYCKVFKTKVKIRRKSLTM